jgi:hypothetical protein
MQGNLMLLIKWDFVLLCSKPVGNIGNIIMGWVISDWFWARTFFGDHLASFLATFEAILPSIPPKTLLASQPGIV